MFFFFLRKREGGGENLEGKNERMKRNIGKIK